MNTWLGRNLSVDKTNDFDDIVGTESFEAFKEKYYQLERVKTLVEDLKKVHGIDAEREVEAILRLEYEERGWLKE